MISPTARAQNETDTIKSKSQAGTSPAPDPEKSGEKSRPEETPELQLTIKGTIPPEQAVTVGRLTDLFYTCYPKLLQRFEHSTRTAPRHITLVFIPRHEVPAFCSGNTITINLDWLRQHPEDLGLLTHELTHAVQRYPRSDPGWLTEGIADYARALYGPERQPGWNLPEKLTPRHSYKNSYGVTARFLIWLEKQHPGTVDELHKHMQDRTFELDLFSKLTGKSVDELWTDCVTELNR